MKFLDGSGRHCDFPSHPMVLMPGPGPLAPALIRQLIKVLRPLRAMLQGAVVIHAWDAEMGAENDIYKFRESNMAGWKIRYLYLFVDF